MDIYFYMILVDQHILELIPIFRTIYIYPILWDLIMLYAISLILVQFYSEMNLLSLIQCLFSLPNFINSLLKHPILWLQNPRCIILYKWRCLVFKQHTTSWMKQAFVSASNLLKVEHRLFEPQLILKYLLYTPNHQDSLYSLLWPYCSLMAYHQI